MGLKYNEKILPFTEQRRIAAVGTKMMGLKPMRGEVVASNPELTRVLSGHSSAYIVRTGPEDVLLVDAGMEEDAGNIRATLEQMGLGAAAVKAIFVTHGHIDHAAGVHVFGDAVVYAHADEQAFLRGEAKGEGRLGKLVGALPEGQAVDAARLKTITHGDEVSIGDVRVKVYAIPGHTTGSMAYQVGDSLFIGDAMFFDKNDQVQLPPPMITSEQSLARRSLVQFVADTHDQGIRTVLPSHSGEGTFEALCKFAERET